MVTYRCENPTTSGCTTIDRSRFEGLVLGIDAVATSLVPNIRVMFSDFVGNGRGIYMAGMNNSVIVENTFELDDPDGWNSSLTFGNSYGLYMEHCSGYQVENNKFKNVYEGWTNGSIVNNSNTGPNLLAANQIYNNEYDGFLLGAGALNNNAFVLNFVVGNQVVSWPLFGLVHRCNKFENTSGADLYNTGPVPAQGACILNQANSPANNLFSTDEPILDLYNLSNVNLTYRFSESNTFITEPRNCLYLPTNTFPAVCENMNYSTRGTCSKRNFLNWQATKHSALSIQEEINSAFAYLFLIDGGNPEALEDAIATGIDQNVLTAFSEVAPYASEASVLHLIENSSSFSDSTIYDVLSMNEPLTQVTIDSIQTSTLPAWIKSNFSSVKGVNPYIELLEKTSFFLNSAMLKVSETLQAMERDSTSIDPYAEIQDFIQSIDLINNDALRLSYAMYYQDSSLVNQIVGDSEWGSELDEFMLLQIAKMSLDVNETSIYHVWADTTGQFQTILECLDTLNSSYIETTLAKINSLATESEYHEEIPEFSLTRMMQITSVPEEKEVALLLFPNPVQDRLHVSIELNDGEVAQCELYNVSGKLMLSDQLRFRKTFVNVDVLEGGVYLVKLIMPDGTMKLGKIIKQ